MPKLHLKDCGLDIKGEINRYMTYLKQKPGSIEDVIAKQQSQYQESNYQDKFKKELDKAGRGIGSMTPKEKTVFFNKVDDIKKTKQESVQTEALTPEKQKEHDKLMKDFIAKGGKIQKIPVGKRNFQGNKLIVRAGSKKSLAAEHNPAELNEGRWRVEGEMWYKGIRSPDNFSMVINATSEKDAINKSEKELEKARKKRWIGPGGGGNVEDIDGVYAEPTTEPLERPSSSMQHSHVPEGETELEEAKYTYSFTITSDYGNDGGDQEEEGTLNASSDKDAENKAEKLADKFCEKINKRKSSVGRPGHFEPSQIDVWKEEVELKEKDGANTSTRIGTASRNAKKKYRFGYRVAEKQPKGSDIEEGASELIKKAVEIAKKMANNYTGATNAIEALKKGLSKDPIVSAALLKANENFVKENVGHQLWGKAVSETENRGDSKLLPSKNFTKEEDDKDEKGASTSKVPVIKKDNKPGVKIAKIRLKRDKMDGAEGSGTKDPAAQEKQILTLQGQLNVLKAKLENEKHKIMKPVASKETGQVPLTIGIASKLLRDKAEKENDEDKKEVKKESVSPYKLKYETLRARLKEKAEKEKLAKKKNEPTKGRTMTGEPATKVDTKPQISYTM